jgi:hypothetical protein
MRKKLLLLIFFFVSLFFLASSSSFLKPALALTCPPTQSGCMLNGATCQKQKNTLSNSTVVCGSKANTPCCVMEWAGGSSCAPSACGTPSTCGASDCTPACDSTLGQTCTGTKPSCTCTGGGGGGGGGGAVAPPTGETPPTGVYLSCITHGQRCWTNITKNGIQCCDPTDSCIPIPWVSFDGNWPGMCGAPASINQVTNCTTTGCDTAFGPISTSPGGVAKALFGVVLGISGGIAILLIILSGYKLMVSRGNPEQVQQAREQLTAAIVGLMFIIFSLVILQSIGVDILQLPGFRQ